MQNRKKYVFVAVMLSVILAMGLLFTSVYVKVSGQSAEDEGFVVVTSFYPMYIAALNIVGDAEGVTLENLSEPQTGCLHDFQLTPEDMKLLSHADAFIINGGGIESFMEEVADAYPALSVIEACENLSLLTDRDINGEEEVNAHAWMSIADYMQMVDRIADGLSEADPDHAEGYREHADLYKEKLQVLQERTDTLREKLDGTKVVLFHEAYAYVAADLGMEICLTMDLDEERQVSAGEVAEVLRAINDDGASVILAEELYGADMADTVKNEINDTELQVLYLDPLTRGEYDPDSYLEGMSENLDLLESIAVTGQGE